jgi:PAS domain S-box-containing protein
MQKNTSVGRRRFNTALLLISAAILITVVVISYGQWRRYSAANAAAAVSREIEDDVDTVLSGLVDAETGQRGFLLTGQDRYLEPYDRAIQAIPGHLAALRGRLAVRPAESANAAALESLVNQKLGELRQTVDLRRTSGANAAIALASTDEGKRIMDQIRSTAAQIKRDEASVAREVATEGEAAAKIALLLTAAGALVIVLLLASRAEPFAPVDIRVEERQWPIRFGAPVIAAIAAALLRAALTPLIGETAVPYITFFPAVLFTTWFGGFRAAAICIVLSSLGSTYFFVEPRGSLLIASQGDQIALVLFILVSIGMAWLGHSQRRALAQARLSERLEAEERNRFQTTLASIGDAVIVTDAEGKVTFANKVALNLLGRTEQEALGRPLDMVFQIVNEFTHAVVESPVARVLREGAIVGLANHTILITPGGAEIPIDDSGAPVRDANGVIRGTVLVFRDVSDRRRAEEAKRSLASIVESTDDAVITKDFKGVITSWNPAAERIFGYTSEEAVGKHISLIAPPGRVDEIPAILDRIRQGEKIDHFQTLRRMRAGTLLHVSLTVSPVRNAVGEITGASKIARDITVQG